MIGHETVLTVSLIYLALLFAVMRFADRRAAAGKSLVDNPYIYTLSLAAFATAWTYYGSIGRATQTGLGYLPFYLGQTLVAMVFSTVLFKIIRIAKTYHLTSIADFAAARYGNSAMIGAIVTLAALVGLLPYLALQLKAIADSFLILSGFPAVMTPAPSDATPIWRDVALYASIILALFIMAFGARHRSTTERHEGMVAAAALDAVIKLIAFIAVGIFVTYGIYDGAADIFERAAQRPDLVQPISFERAGDYTAWASMLAVSVTAVMFLPRQFQIGVVENVRAEHLRTATWLFPLYLFAINLFVLPIALGGLLRAPVSARGDTYLLLLPLLEGANGLGWFVFIGGLSAITIMIAFETLALGNMVINNLVLPVWIRLHRPTETKAAPNLLLLRRVSTGVLLAFAYLYYRGATHGHTLATMGIISFVAVAQFAPAILGGLYWRHATRRGALAGLSLGFTLWFYTLLLPTFVETGWIPRSFVDLGPFGIQLLRPQVLLGLGGLDSVVHSIVWSLLANTSAFLIVSLFTEPDAAERLQARRFIKASEDHVALPVPAPNGDVADVHRLLTRFLGVDGADDALAAYAIQRLGHNRIDALVVDADLMQFVEALLAGAIGVTSTQPALMSAIQKDPTRDGLTGLPSLPEFNKHVTASLERAKRDENYRFAIACLNLDRYRTIANSLGYHVGEQLLIAVSNRLDQQRRSGDVLTRVSGDEFALLLENVSNGPEATRRTESFRRVLTPPFHLSGRDIFVTASAGVALGDNARYEHAEAILRDAETTMLDAKTQKRGYVELFEPNMHDRAADLFDLETDLRRSIRRGELEIHYQPIMTLQHQRLWGFEALVRWRHPQRGLLVAADFIPLSEETGLILSIGDWMLHGACRQMHEWHLRFPSATPLHLSVNISVKQFAQPGLIERISHSLDQTKLDPRTLDLEITESALFENDDLACALLTQLRAMHIQLSIDDFGTGYSSLSYLQRFPIDTLKIDRSFVKHMEADSKKTRIIAATIALAHNLGLPVIVEGVESQQQAEQLVALNANFGQGYYFSAPLATDTAESFIRSHFQ